jgi:hypothetical protein
MSGLVALGLDGELQKSFPQVTDAMALALAADGRLVVGGAFDVLRLQRDGTLDTNFICQTSSVVEALTTLPDGKIAIAGQFGSVNSIPAGGVARILAEEAPPPPIILKPFVSIRGFEMSVPTVTNAVYRVEFTTHLGQFEWKTLKSFAGDGEWAPVLDEDPMAADRFYRVRAE